MFWLLALLGLAFGLVEEEVKSNCPADPTFGGRCSLVEVKTDGPECREIDGLRVCRDWWERERLYRCEGVTVGDLLSSLEGYEYCTYERECVSWAEVPKEGGTISCRVYYDKNRPGCDENPYRAECLTDDCGELFEKCRLLDYVPYSDVPDKANPETTEYCDPVSGVCGYKSVPSTSGVSVGIYTFECPPSVRKVCTKSRVVKSCPGGKSEVCNEVRVCKEWKGTTAVGKTLRSCVVKRAYEDRKAVKGSAEAQALKNSPSCVKLGERTEVEEFTLVFSWGWDGDGGDKCNSCESYVTGLTVRELNLSSGECFMVSPSPGVFPSSSQMLSFVNKFLSGRPYSVAGVDLGKKRGLGREANPNDRVCFGDDDPPAPNEDYEVPVSLAVTYEVFRCFKDELDYSSCEELKECSPVSPTQNLEELECYELVNDAEDPTKALCSAYFVNYECEDESRTQTCARWETEVVCSSDGITIPELEIRGRNFSEDFKKAVSYAQLLNELKHVWSGEPKVCESGWWNSIIQDPTSYFVSKMVGMAVSYFGKKVVDVARSVATGASACLRPGVGDFTRCFYEVAKDKYDEIKDKTIAQELLCKPDGSKTMCSFADFMSNPWVQFGVSLAVDLILSTEKCNSCTDEDCAVRHNDYQEYVLVSKGLCRIVGSKCTWEIDLGFTKVCLRRGYKYCCWDSPLARVLVEEAYKQLGYSFGSYDSPNCSALTFEDLKRLDFSKMDLSELIRLLDVKAQGELSEEDLKSRLENFYGGER